MSVQTSAPRSPIDGLADSRPRTFFGHPIGLAYLAFTEAFERFSYYGMQALVVLYMVDQLLRPGHAEHVLGLVGLRRGVEGVFGPLSIQAFSSQIFGIYTALIYVTPVFGGVLGDRWLGRRLAVTLGALIMAAGHFMMAFEPSFLLALGCLVLGGGLIKGNIACQVGQLYAPGDGRRDDAYQVFVASINMGAIASPLVCGTLGEVLGWHYGFAAAGVGMLVSIGVYVAGYPHLPPETAGRSKHVAPPPVPLTREDWRAVIAIVCMLPLFACVMVPNNQIFNVGLLWARKYLDLNVFGLRMPVTWTQSIDSVLTVVGLGLVVAGWRWLRSRGVAPDELTKTALGAGLAITAAVVQAALSLAADQTGWKIPIPVYMIVSCIIVAAYANYFPTGYAIVSRAAPPQLGAAMLGVFMLFLVGTNFIVGWMGSYYEKLGAPLFWLAHAIFPLITLLMLTVFRRPLRSALRL